MLRFMIKYLGIHGKRHLAAEAKALDQVSMVGD